MIRDELLHRAQALGFERMAVAGPQPLDSWYQLTQADPRPNWANISHDARSLLPGARAVVMLAFPYHPYRERPNEPGLDGYYVASNAAHERVKGLAEWLISEGHAALFNPSLPYKPMVERSGLGQYGRNGLIAVEAWGSRVAIQAILTDAPLEPDADCDQPGFSSECENCRMCVAACPTGALKGDGRVDMDRCLRALVRTPPVPEIYRHLFLSLLGCDLCQRRCPRNRAVAPVDMPEQLAQAISLHRLLDGQTADLVPWLGSNNARKGRVLAAATLLTANLGRTDLLHLLHPLANHPIEGVAEHAAWALRVLQNANPPQL